MRREAAQTRMDAHDLGVADHRLMTVEPSRKCHRGPDHHAHSLASSDAMKAEHEGDRRLFAAPMPEAHDDTGIPFLPEASARADAH
jgi:hypothetical protein